jgi:hypothetical protein
MVLFKKVHLKFKFMKNNFRTKTKVNIIQLIKNKATKIIKPEVYTNTVNKKKK